MIKVGLTGGIGSGKTTVAQIFEVLGIPVYYADQRAKMLMSVDEDLKQGIIKAFGADSYTESGLDRAYLASVVFHDEQKLKQLNALVHPAVGRDYRAWVEAVSGEAAYCMKEAAILFETGGHREMNHTILVSAPEELRIDRVMKRDGVTEDQVRARMSKQWTEEEKIPLVDSVIINDGAHSLIQQVLTIHQGLSKL